jgi:CheY-like chemotaxis protein
MCASTAPKIKVVVVGMTLITARRLCRTIESISPGQFAFQTPDQRFDVLESAELDDTAFSSLEDLDPGDLEDCVVIAGGAGKQPLLDAAQRLRAEQLFWGPLHLFLRYPQADGDREREWALEIHQLPPRLPEDTARKLARPRTVSETRRREIVAAAMRRAAEELRLLRRSLEPVRTADIEHVRASLGRVQDAPTPVEAEFPALAQQLARLRTAADIPAQEAAAVRAVVAAAEAQARKTPCLGELTAALHALNSALAAAQTQPENPRKAIHRIKLQLGALRERGVTLLPDPARREVEEACADLLELVGQISKARSSRSAFLSKLSEGASILHASARSVAPFLPTEGHGKPIRRVIIAENDPVWRSRIAEFVSTIDPSLEVEPVSTIERAEASLKRQEDPALAIVGLILPREETGALELDAGLLLIKKFTGINSEGKRGLFTHRFVVLTAAEGHTEAVRQADRYGLSSQSYLHKDPALWQAELRLQLRLILQPPPKRLPVVEILMSTGCLARVEGMQFKPHEDSWRLLASFAELPGKWRQPLDLIDRLSVLYGDEPENDVDNKESEKWLRKRVSKLRVELTEIYRESRKQAPPANLIEEDDIRGYKVNAQLEQIENVGYRYSHRPTVLIVEDDYHLARKIAKTLRESGFKPRCALYTDEAWKKIGAKAPDLISLDVQVPVTAADWKSERADAANAVAFLRALRQDYPGLPVAVLTGALELDHAMLEITRQGVSVTRYLHKQDLNPLMRLVEALESLWQERLYQTRIAAEDPDVAFTPLHPIRIDRNIPLLRSVGDYEINLKKADLVTRFLSVLSATPNMRVSPEILIESLWDDPDKMPIDPDNRLSKLKGILCKEITRQTSGRIPGDQVICGRKFYYLRGIEGE